MTDNSARKRAIRALAATEGISYTAASRRYAEGATHQSHSGGGTAVSAAQLGFLQRLMRTPAPAEPLPSNQWRLSFELRPDLSAPIDLYVTTGGLIGQQSFWRGEKFQIIGFCDTPDPEGGIALHWSEFARAYSITNETSPSALDFALASSLTAVGAAERAAGGAVGRYPVISDIHGTWSTWDTRIADITFTATSPDPVDGAPAVVATFSATDDRATFGAADEAASEGEEPYFNFRVDDLLSALSDDTLRQLAADDWVAGATESGLLYRAALMRHDHGALTASWWVDAQYETDPQRWADDEPYRLVLDERAAQQWLEKTHPALG